MGTSPALMNEKKKRQDVSPEAAPNQVSQHVPSVKKENLRPDLKREYELTEKYILNFTGSSF